jgi:hypothetical protein
MSNKHWLLEEMDRQMIIRALAVQAHSAPGFRDACAKIAENLQGTFMFDEFYSLLDGSVLVEGFDPRDDPDSVG